MKDILAKFEAVAANPLEYARDFKRDSGKRVIGLFPMHFPGELAHAAGALPIVLQADDEPVTIGQGSVFNFYCGYNRSIVDQAMRGEFAFLDAILFGDHCVQLLGTADIIRDHLPDTPILFNQLISIIDAEWAMEETQGTFRQLWRELEDLTGEKISDDQVRHSIGIFNRNRALIRQIYDMRRAGRIALTGSQMQHIVKSSMIMDKETHTALLEELVAKLEAAPPANNAVRVYLSGHLCHAAKLPILDLVEECGGVVVDDDLYTGYRYIAADVEETGSPVDALSRWYLEKNKKIPCPTRADKDLDWEDFLLAQVDKSGAQGLIVLMVKFCEPHMYFYPEIKEAFERRGIPHLMIETEHEEMPMEALKTRMETFLEIAKRRVAA
ncbi:MAG: 2-hydroxyacyl-CoA dehydratase [Rhodobiaceae bacterium]|nr:2-hydroxyacyl-CoA dehydratase [Rhodobiaceae bacterium]MCC0054513.1 2-hydroxyacyl-CoA dehydratase [Rhodobiaceae bacterium]